MSKPVLPSFSTIIDATSASSSPLPRSSSMGFRMDIQGNIKLPPLSAGSDPQTPIVKNNLLSITPTTSMLRVGTASMSSVDVHHVTDSVGLLAGSTSLLRSATHQSQQTAKLSQPTPVASGQSISTHDLSVKLNVADNSSLQHTPSKKSKVAKRVQDTNHSLILADPESLSQSDSSRASTKKKNSKTKSFAFITHSQETFPSNEPSIDNAQLARRKRRRTSKNESNILKREFELNPAPSKERRAELSLICNMSEKAVQVWFQNRRQNFRKKYKSDSKQYNSPLDDASNSTVDSDSTSESQDPNSPNFLNSNREQKIISSGSENLREANQGQSSPITISTDSSVACQSNSANDGPIVSSTDEQKFQKKLKLDIPRYTTAVPVEKASSPSDKGKVLTFRLKQDNALSRVYTSPNNRVNKLINGSIIDEVDPSTPAKIMSQENVKITESANTNNGKLDFRSNRGILKEINVNAV